MYTEKIKKSFSKNGSQVSGYAKREQTERDEDARILERRARDLENEHSRYAYFKFLFIKHNDTVIFPLLFQYEITRKDTMFSKNK